MEETNPEMMYQCSTCRRFKKVNEYQSNRCVCNKCLEIKAIYRENNKEKLKEKAKNYYQEHKEEILDKNSQKIECQYCRCLISRGKLYNHIKTKKHQKYVKEHQDFIDSDLN